MAGRNPGLSHNVLILEFGGLALSVSNYPKNDGNNIRKQKAPRLKGNAGR